MNYILIAIIVGGFVAYLLYKNISHITNHLDNLGDTSFEFYSEYSLFLNGIIKQIKQEIDYPKENSKYRLKDVSDNLEISAMLSSFIRKLVFFETVMAKQKSKEEIEAELYKILNSLDESIKNSFVDGEVLADELSEFLRYEFENLRKKF